MKTKIEVEELVCMRTVQPVIGILAAVLTFYLAGLQMAIADSPTIEVKARAQKIEKAYVPETVQFEPSLEPLITVPDLSSEDIHEIQSINQNSRKGPRPPIRGKLKKANKPSKVFLGQLLAENDIESGYRHFKLRSTNEYIEIAFNVNVDSNRATRVLISSIENIEQMEVYLADQSGSFGAARYSSGWSDRMLLPYSRGPLTTLYVRLPLSSTKAKSARFTVVGAAIMASVDENSDCESRSGDWHDCALDSSCVGFSKFEADPRDSGAVLSFLYSEDQYLAFCSANLIIQRHYMQPYLLTADHCFSSEPSLDTLAAVFDYRSDACGGSPPGLETLPQVVGAEMIKRSSDNDMAFLRLNGIPSGQLTHLGWTTEGISGNVHRVSHPAGTKQRYTRSSATTHFNCLSLPTSRYWHTENNMGSFSGGSSGSTVFNSDAQILGQLYGTCHQENWNRCDPATFRAADGKFSESYPNISPWLERPAAVGLENGVELGGQSNAELPLKMTYYFFYSPAFDDYEIVLEGDIEGADLYVNRTALFPIAGLPSACKVENNSTFKRCVLSGGALFRVGVYARDDYHNASIMARRIVPGVFRDRFESPPPRFVFDDIEFAVDSATNGGGGYVVIRYVGVTWSDLSGFSFSGNVNGISGSSSWASDLQMEVHTPDGHVVVIGGYDDTGIPWEFQGAGSSDDGSYKSSHRDVFSGLNPDSFGEWVIVFKNDWNNADAATMEWDDVKLEFY